MKIHSKTAHYKCSPEKLFQLLSKEENLPKWATLFCHSIRKEGDDYIASTPSGDMYFKISADKDTGVIDMKAGPTKDQLWGGAQRVVSDNMGGSVFIFTHFQAPGESEESFSSGCDGLDVEFEVIRKIVD